MSLEGAKYIIKVRKISDYLTTYVVAAKTVEEALYRLAVDDGCVEAADTDVYSDEQKITSVKEIQEDDSCKELLPLKFDKKKLAYWGVEAESVKYLEEAL